jgi:predicted membrane channel-forming protein YqfA (hemolysin III family)
MFSSGTHWGIFLFGIVLALVPLLYLRFGRKFKLKTFFYLFVGAAAVFGLIHSLFKGGTVGFGWFMVMFNTLFLFALGAYLFMGFFSLGSFLERKLLHFQQHRWQEMLISL